MSSNLVKTAEFRFDCSDIPADFFMIGGEAIAFGIAFIPADGDFAGVCAALSARAPCVPIVAATSAGALCAGPGIEGGLYRSSADGGDRFVFLGCGRKLVAAVAVAAIPLDAPERMSTAIRELSFPFSIRSADTVGLTLMDGANPNTAALMTALYGADRFPCLFAGGMSAAGVAPGSSRLYDGRSVLREHAVIAFLKLQPGFKCAVFQTQNFIPTERTLTALDVGADQRTVETVVDPKSFRIKPALSAVRELIGDNTLPPEELFRTHTFGLSAHGRFIPRAVARCDDANATVSFYSDIRTGDRLHLARAADFAARTKADYGDFLAGKPPPEAAILFDCILRRQMNADALSDLDGIFSTCPSAGFSTFGELNGVDLNQTLVAVVFFRDNPEQSFDGEDRFPLDYAGYRNHYTEMSLSRADVVNDLRSAMIAHLTETRQALTELSAEIHAAAQHDRQLEAVRRDAEIDPLSGAHNRRALATFGEKQFAIARRGGLPLAAAMIDLDHFKTVNDVWGHAEGDRIIREFAAIVARKIRASDMLVRMGGEEFLAILPGVHIDNARDLAERIRRDIENNLFAGTPPQRVTASFGVAAVDAGCASLTELCRRADAALYAAKRNGRNRVEIAAQSG